MAKRRKYSKEFKREAVGLTRQAHISARAARASVLPRKRAMGPWCWWDQTTSRQRPPARPSACNSTSRTSEPSPNSTARPREHPNKHPHPKQKGLTGKP